MDAVKELIKTIQMLAGKYSGYEIFCDWTRCCALMISNSCQLIRNAVWEAREKQYLDTMQRYTEPEQQLFGDMMGMLMIALEEDIRDVLGEVYMQAGLGSKEAGQFFTPFHVSLLCARMALKDEDGSRIITLNEPSTGGGGMIIAAARVLWDKGINYQRCLDVIAQDLDYKGVYMTYIQLSLLGIKATVVQGDTLGQPFVPGRYPPEKVFLTPARRGMLL